MEFRYYILCLCNNNIFWYGRHYTGIYAILLVDTFLGLKKIKKKYVRTASCTRITTHSTTSPYARDDGRCRAADIIRDRKRELTFND